jgi:hypothetical protein
MPGFYPLYARAQHLLGLAHVAASEDTELVGISQPVGRLFQVCCTSDSGCNLSRNEPPFSAKSGCEQVQ